MHDECTRAVARGIFRGMAPVSDYARHMPADCRNMYGIETAYCWHSAGTMLAEREKALAGVWSGKGLGASARRRPAIPRRVASPQSPTPFCRLDEAIPY